MNYMFVCKEYEIKSCGCEVDGGVLWCVGCVIVRVFAYVYANEDTYMNFNLYTVDLPSIEDGPQLSDFGIT